VIEVPKARAALLAEAQALDVVEVDLDAAHGRVLAEELRADRDQPPTDRSAMDGYAVRCADLEGGVELELAGEVRAGQPLGDARVEPGRALRIFTGGIVPPGADAVVMVEHTEERGSTVRFFRKPGPGQHIRRRGEEIAEGQLVLPAGVRVDAPEIAALATVGCTRVKVHRAPVVAVLSTGDEVVEPEHVPADHQVRNSNARAMLAQLRELGAKTRYLGIAGDDEDALARSIERGLDADVLLLTGGVSVGRYDLVRATLERAGMKLLFHKVAMRPGKPVLAGRAGDCVVIGLPGNPVSAFTGLHVLVAPLLRKLGGMRRVAGPRVRATLTAALPHKQGRMTFHLGRVEWRGGRYEARPARSASSGDVLSLVRANAYLVTPAEAEEKGPGDEVAAFLWHESHFREPID
jgi:molybdopterin molybdotransferase